MTSDELLPLPDAVANIKRFLASKGFICGSTTANEVLRVAIANLQSAKPAEPVSRPSNFEILIDDLNIRSGTIEMIASMHEEPTINLFRRTADASARAMRAAVKALNILWLSHHANRTDDAIEQLEAALASYEAERETK